MKYKIAILGSAVNESPQALEQAVNLGSILANYFEQIILLNGACPGMPDQVVNAARNAGDIEIWGYSSSISRNQQLEENPKVALGKFKKMFYVPQKFEFSSNVNVCRKYRNVILTANCDAGIIVSGRWGTLNEFTNLYDMGKVIGVLTGTGGAADLIPDLSKKISKISKAIVIFDSSPEVLINKVIAALNERNKM